MKEVNYTCKTCQQPARMILKNEEEIREFATYTKGFNCEKCAYEYWKAKFETEPWKLRHESKDFIEKWQELERKYKTYEK